MPDSALWLLLIGAVATALGGAFGYVIRQAIASRGYSKAKDTAEKLLAHAASQQKELLLEAKEEGIRLRAAAEAENRERRSELQRQERRLRSKEENLDQKLEAHERRDKTLNNRQKELETAHAELVKQQEEQLRELERISGLSQDDAKEALLQAVEAEVRHDASRRIREIEDQLREEADEKAREIIATALQRCATDVVSETTVAVVPLPNDDMKGRIIGREGRNIRALEAATGVDLIIDDTPDAVTLSSFDPVRREIARVALTKLVLDGRIHPARIEEMVAKATQEVEVTIRRAGEEACYEAEVSGLHPELVRMLGRLKFRFSYGQNVLQHSLEVAHLAAMMAAELGADVEVAKKAGLLHDIGKAVSHEVEGPHASVGAELARKHGKSPQVVHAIRAHHNEEEPASVEAVIVATADALSGGRPGARRESLERYVKRLEALEAVANSFAGVERSFAIQAGRELRIIVRPEDMDDLAALRLARDVVGKIEETLDYPGQIKVTVVRETRAVEYAR